MTPAVVAVTSKDIDRVISVIGAAFHDDPVWSFAFPDKKQRQAQYAVFWRLLVEGAMRYGTVWLTPGGEAVSVWLPPGGTELAAEAAAGFEPLVRDLMRDDADRLLVTVDRFAAARPEKAHHYLSLLATDPQHRGSGLGVALLTANLQAIDAVHEPAYLESTNPRNLERYRRLGFVENGSFDLPDKGPGVTRMWRPAR